MDGKICVLTFVGFVSLDMFDDVSLPEDIRELTSSTNWSGN